LQCHTSGTALNHKTELNVLLKKTIEDSWGENPTYSCFPFDIGHLENYNFGKHCYLFLLTKMGTIPQTELCTNLKKKNV
jgi:hypothetical protein